MVPRSRNQRASVTGFQEFKNGALLQNGIQNLHINHSFKLTYAGRFGGGGGVGVVGLSGAVATQSKADCDIAAIAIDCPG